MKLYPELLEATMLPVTGLEILGQLRHMPEDDRKSSWMLSYRNYPLYEALGRILKPERVLEIGVRLGYSLVALLKQSPTTYHVEGLDIESYVPGSNRMAYENIRLAGYDGELLLHTKNSRDWMPDGPFDFIHVDGCHGELEAKADILDSWTRLAPGGILVADDVDLHPEVRRAVDGAILYLLGCKSSFFFKSAAGCFIAEKS